MSLALLLAQDRVGAAAQPPPTEQTHELTLPQALSLALSRSPELQAHAWAVRAAHGQQTYAGQVANPELAIEVEDFLGSGALEGFGSAQTTLRLSQTLELGGKRGARRDVAQRNLAVVESEYSALRLAVLAETSIRFVHVVADQSRLTVARDARALAEAALAAARRRVAGGSASPVEERRASILLARSKIEEEHAEHELLASRRRLAALWGDTAPGFEQARAELFARRPLPPYEEMAMRVDGNPELVRLTRMAAARQADLALAEVHAIPDVRVGAGGRRLDGPDAFGLVFGLSAPLPLFQRNEGAILAASAGRAQLDAEREATRARVLATLYGQYQERVHTMTELDALERDVLPNAEGMLEVLGAGFAVGRFSQLELLDAQRMLIDLRREQINAAEELHTLTVQIEALLGVAPAGYGHGDDASTEGSRQDGGTR